MYSNEKHHFQLPLMTILLQMIHFPIHRNTGKRRDQSAEVAWKILPLLKIFTI